MASDSLQTVLDYLTIEGFPEEEYKVLSSWPRRDVSSRKKKKSLFVIINIIFFFFFFQLTALDTNQTLKELKLYPQETLTLEEKH